MLVLPYVVSVHWTCCSARQADSCRLALLRDGPNHPGGVYAPVFGIFLGAPASRICLGSSSWALRITAHIDKFLNRLPDSSDPAETGSRVIISVQASIACARPPEFKCR